MTSLRAHLDGVVRERPRRLIAYLTLCDPDRGASRQHARDLVEAGCAALELGLPTVEPPDNTSVVRSHDRARAAGGDALELAAELAAELPVPVVLLAYWSALKDARALEEFLRQASAASVAATLVVGLPWLHLAGYRRLSDAKGLETVLSVRAEMSPSIRASVYAAATGCVYLVSRGPDTAGDVALVRAEMPLPVVVGGGITTAADVAMVSDAGAIAVMGAPIVDRVERGEALAPFVHGLLHGG